MLWDTIGLSSINIRYQRSQLSWLFQSHKGFIWIPYTNGVTSYLIILHAEVIPKFRCWKTCFRDFLGLVSIPAQQVTVFWQAFQLTRPFVDNMELSRSQIHLEFMLNPNNTSSLIKSSHQHCTSLSCTSHYSLLLRHIATMWSTFCQGYWTHRHQIQWRLLRTVKPQSVVSRGIVFPDPSLNLCGPWTHSI